MIIPGQNKGLTVLLDAHSDKAATYSVGADYKGFTAIVHEQNSFPLTLQKGIRIQPGKENMVAISAIDIKSEEDLLDTLPERRGCYFPEDKEAKLNLYKNYSQVC